MVHDPQYITAEEYERARWKGPLYFRCLGYYFSIRWNRKRFGDAVEHVLGTFSVPEDPSERRNPPTPGLPHEYTLFDRGPKCEDEPRFKLLYDGIAMYQNHRSGLVLDFLFSHVNGEVFRSTADFLTLHAGAVVSPSGAGVIFPALSGSGKSTLVAGLVQAGFGYLSDEIAAIDPVGRRLYPYPKTLNLKEGSFDLFPELRARAGRVPFIGHQWHLRAEDIRPASIGGPCPVRFVVFTRYVKGAATELTPVGRGEALRNLMSSLFNLKTYGGRALHLLGDITRTARAVQLVTGDLREATEAIASLVGGNGRGDTPDLSREEGVGLLRNPAAFVQYG